MNYAGRNIRYLIAKLSLRQADIEEVVGKRQTTISNWIVGKSQPDAEDLIKLNQFFGITIDDLCYTDLEQGNLITQAYVEKFKQNGNLKGNLLGNLNEAFYQNIGTVPAGKDEQEVNLWVLLNLLKQMDGKLDLLSNRVAELEKQKG